MYNWVQNYTPFSWQHKTIYFSFKTVTQTEEKWRNTSGTFVLLLVALLELRGHFHVNFWRYSLKVWHSSCVCEYNVNRWTTVNNHN
jgi:hypothetical protein